MWLTLSPPPSPVQWLFNLWHESVVALLFLTEARPGVFWKHFLQSGDEVCFGTGAKTTFIIITHSLLVESVVPLLVYINWARPGVFWKYIWQSIISYHYRTHQSIKTQSMVANMLDVLPLLWIICLTHLPHLLVYQTTKSISNIYEVTIIEKLTIPSLIWIKKTPKISIRISRAVISVKSIISNVLTRISSSLLFNLSFYNWHVTYNDIYIM